MLPKTLLARSFLLMVLLIMSAFSASVAIFRHAEQQPRIDQTAQLVVSVVNLTRAAVLSAAPEWRSALLSELAETEGLRLQMAEPDDALEPIPDHPQELLLMTEKVRTILGDKTRFAAQRDGVDALWVSFYIGKEEFWVALPMKRIEHPESQVLLIWSGVALALALLGAYFIAREVAQPLKLLAQAAQQVGLGVMPPQLSERGVQEIATLSRAFNQMSSDIASTERERALVLAGISHDLRTPLSRVRLAAELSQDEFLRDGLIKDVEQMDEVIRQFLDYARLDASEAAVSTDLQALVREEAQKFAAILTLDLQQMPPIAAHPLLLRRALSNLLSNAVKYGGGEITVQLGQDENNVILTVADRGPGIPAEQRDAAKRPFVRLESARSDVTGSGLGLAIVERVARLSGGEFHLEERAGGGLAARLVLPKGMGR